MIPERRSCRAFRAEPLPAATLDAIFADAQRAPSWCNVQPWRVVVASATRARELSAALVAAAMAGPPASELAFPVDYPTPYRELRRECGIALYQAMGVDKTDQAGRYAAWLRNYQLFDAPHVAIVACDRRLGPYAYVDVGVWLGYVLIAAASRGVASCPMASVAAYPNVLRAHLPIAETDVILFAIALGFADTDAPANRCHTAREPVATNITLL